MNDFLANTWTVGIGGGIISGLFVFLITNRIFSKRDNKVYLQNVRIANTELRYAVRSMVVEFTLPTAEIFASIKASTAKKHLIDVHDLQDHIGLADDLTKEIMDNSFLNSKTKMAYCQLTSQLKELLPAQSTPSAPPFAIANSIPVGQVSHELFSLTLALITTLTVSATMWAFSSERIQLHWEKSSGKLLVVVALNVLIPTLAVWGSKTIGRTRKKKSDENPSPSIPESSQNT